MTRLLVVGDSLLDRDVEGTVDRICPDAPAPVLDVGVVRDRPGGAGLAALLAVRPGTEVTLATGLGVDAAGQRVRVLLDGVARLHAVLEPPTTPGKTRVRAQGHCLVRLDDGGHLLGGVPELAGATEDGGVTGVDEEALEALVLASDAVLVADYGGAVTRHPVVRRVLRRHAAAVPVVWDPHPRGQAPVRGVRVATPNRAEALGFSAALGPSEVARAAAGEGDLAETGARLRDRWGVDAVTVTDGARGAVVVDGGAPAVRCTAPACPPPVDTCGAGDRFAGAVALGLARGESLRAAVEAATRDVAAWLLAGGVVTAPTPRLPLEVPVAADEMVARTRAAGGVVVATGGCFDVLHAGHLALLEAARALGDCLVVVLNSDASTRRLKGAGRPVNSAADRTRLLEAMRCVDAVAVFEDDEPSATLARLRPDVWVKGGDYRPQDLPEAPVVRSCGGRVEVVPFLAGRSTTAVLHRVGAAARQAPDGP